jgi:hypothetical protein
VRDQSVSLDLWMQELLEALQYDMGLWNDEVALGDLSQQFFFSHSRKVLLGLGECVNSLAGQDAQHLHAEDGGWAFLLLGQFFGD